MKTIGLLTMHRVKNYGSFLQTFATYLFLSKKGYKCEIINYDYPNEYHNKVYLSHHQQIDNKKKYSVFIRKNIIKVFPEINNVLRVTFVILTYSHPFLALCKVAYN